MGKRKRTPGFQLGEPLFAEMAIEGGKKDGRQLWTEAPAAGSAALS